MKKSILNLLSICCICILLVHSSCSNEQGKPRLTFGNDIENSYWKESSSTIKFPQAHSGNFVCKINKENPFSYTMDIRVKDISDKPLKRLKVSAWFMLTSNASEQNLVLDVRDSSLQNSFEWLNIDAADNNNELNKWGKAELVVDLTKKDRNNPNNVYRIYASNGREETVYVDDFEVSFE